MPAAQNREDLITTTLKEFAKLETTLATVSAGLADRPAEGEVASIKDTIIHRTHWISLFIGWYERGKTGEPVQTPADGYKWNQLKAYNAKLREEMKDLPWDKALAAFTKAHGELRRLIEQLDNETLYTKHLYGWMNNWTLGRWAEASGSSHYRSANAYIRKVIRQQAAP